MVFSWPENHNMHHRTSTDPIRQSMCDIGFCILLARKSQHASTDSIRQSMCDIVFCILLAKKSQHASTDSIRQSMCDIQACATHPLLLDNLPHWGERFDKIVNHSPSKTDVRPPSIPKKHVIRLGVTFRKR